jgi:hypothetical protein
MQNWKTLLAMQNWKSGWQNSDHSRWLSALPTRSVPKLRKIKKEDPSSFGSASGKRWLQLPQMFKSFAICHL